MTTEKRAQEIFNLVTIALENVVTRCQSQEELKLWPTNGKNIPTLEMGSPCEKFLSQIKQKLNEEEFDETLFTKLYKESFQIGLPQRGINYKTYQASLTVTNEEVTRTSTLKLWTDLDRLTATLNDLLGCSAHQQYTVKYSSNTDESIHRFKRTIESSVQSAINGVNDPGQRFKNHFLISLVSGMASGYALLIASLALASVLSLGSVAVGTLLVTGVVAGVTSYGFFTTKNSFKTNPKQAATYPDHKPIEDVFSEHFAKFAKDLQQETDDKEHLEKTGDLTLFLS